MSPRPASELRALLDRGEWLSPGEVAVILGVNRQTIHRMLTDTPPGIRYRVKPGTGQYRECDPDDVRRLLAERTIVHGDPPRDVPWPGEDAPPPRAP